MGETVMQSRCNRLATNNATLSLDVPKSLLQRFIRRNLITDDGIADIPRSDVEPSILARLIPSFFDRRMRSLTLDTLLRIATALDVDLWKTLKKATKRSSENKHSVTRDIEPF